MIGYIYLITNTITNKQYVGQTINTVQHKFKQHVSDAKHSNNNMYLHRSMAKYGVENFVVEEIIAVEANERSKLKEKLNYLEKYYIVLYNILSPNGYNLTKGGDAISEQVKIKVDEYDLDGNFIKMHDSLIDAARSVGSEFNTGIYKCCYGISKFAFQRIWRFHGEPFNK